MFIMLNTYINLFNDEESWSNDAPNYSFMSNSLYQVQPGYISKGTLENSFNKDYYHG